MSELMPWEVEIRQQALKTSIQRAIAKGRSASIFEGRRLERVRILHLAESLICFEHHKGCDHSGCYAIVNLISYIKEGTK
jgi:hypothetical protein